MLTVAPPHNAVALEFLQSQEFRGDVVQGNFDTLLHRSPSAVEVNNWVMSGLDASQIRLGFESSLEFYTNG
jgi:hypothetical protein